MLGVKVKIKSFKISFSSNAGVSKNDALSTKTDKVLLLKQ